MDTDKGKLMELAKDIATEYCLDPTLVKAVVEQESGWNTWADRYEPAFEVWLRPRVAGLTATQYKDRSTSYGLMQVMGEVAAEQGFTGRFYTQLCDPAIGLMHGCLKLKKCLERAAGNVHQALLAYNGGGNLQYPDEVKARMAHYAA